MRRYYQRRRRKHDAAYRSTRSCARCRDCSRYEDRSCRGRIQVHGRTDVARRPPVVLRSVGRQGARSDTCGQGRDLDRACRRTESLPCELVPRLERHGDGQGRLGAAGSARRTQDRSARCEAATDDADREVRRQEAQQSERSGLCAGRLAVVHRSALRTAETRCRSRQGTVVQWCLPLRRRQASGSPQGSDAAERSGLLTGRQDPLCRELRTEAIRQCLRGRYQWHDHALTYIHRVP